MRDAHVVKLLFFVLLILVLLSLMPFMAHLARAQVAHVVQNKVLIGTSSTPVLAARPLRIFLILENISDTDVYCKLDGTAAVNQEGTLIYSNGGKTFWDVPPTVPRNSIACIHAGSGQKTLLYTEQY